MQWHELWEHDRRIIEETLKKEEEESMPIKPVLFKHVCSDMVGNDKLPSRDRQKMPMFIDKKWRLYAMNVTQPHVDNAALDDVKFCPWCGEDLPMPDTSLVYRAEAG